MTNCSVTIHINSHGSLYQNNFFTITGDLKNDYITTNEFIDIIKPLYDNSISIKNISIITDFCYSKLNFSKELNTFGSTYELKNTIFMSLRPILREYIILQRFLQSNPPNFASFTDFLSKSGLIYSTILRNNNMLFDGENELNQIIDSLAIFLQKFNNRDLIMQNLIDVQKSSPYNSNPYNDSIFSNVLINLFEETNGIFTLTNFFNLIYNPINYNLTVAAFNRIFVNDQIQRIQSENSDYNKFFNSMYGPFSAFLWNFNLLDETKEFIKQLVIYSLNKANIIDGYSQNQLWFRTQLLKDIF